MTVQQLKYIITVAEIGSITEAARQLFISQPSLSGAIKEVENEAKLTIFNRCRAGVALTPEGMEFVGYARQVVQQMELLESRFVNGQPEKQRFCVSTQHYTFAANAFADLITQFGQERYEFIMNETQTHQIIEDVRNRFSDLGLLYLCDSNESVLRKLFEDYNLAFHELFTASPHIFLDRDHPLARKKALSLQELKPYPRLSFVQGAYESSNFAEELFSNETVDKSIRVSDRAAVVNLMIGLQAYTISSGIYAKYLHGDRIISVPLREKGKPLFLGIFTGYYVVQIICAVFVYGIASFLPSVLGIMKYIGAAYILWLAIHIAISKPEQSDDSKSASYIKDFLLQFVNVKIYLFGMTALTGYITDYYTSLTALVTAELFIATLGSFATLTWIGMGALIQKFYLKHYRIVNILLALTLVECIISILK